MNLFSFFFFFKMMNRHLAPLFSRQVVSGGFLTQKAYQQKAGSLEQCKLFLQSLSSRQNSSSFTGIRTGCVARQSSFSSSNQSKISVSVYLPGEVRHQQSLSLASLVERSNHLPFLSIYLSLGICVSTCVPLYSLSLAIVSICF